MGPGVGGIALDGAGHLFASRSFEPTPLDPSTWQMQVVRVETNGSLTPIAGAGPGFAGDGGPAKDARFFYPYDVAFDRDGNLYVADGLNRRVRRISDAGAPASVGEDTIRFITRAYLDLLGRQATAVEISFWAYFLVNGMPPEWLGGVLVTTTEFRLLVAVATYHTWLGRAPTEAEAKAVANRIGTGATLEQVWADLAGSEESWARHGRSASAYVDDLYRLGFGREPDPAGKAFWVGKLTSGYSRSQAALAFALNPAGSANIVRQCYDRYLGHPADPVGLDFWVTQLQKGFRSEYVLAFFVGSNEYRARG
jgi:hypothetical protein